MQTVKAVIMAGGQGSRLRPLTCDRPKPMVPILEQPIVAHIVRLLAGAGVQEALTTLHPMPDQVMDFFGDGSGWGVSIRHLVEEEPVGTAGSVARARPFLDGTLLVMSGDALTDLELEPVLRFHRQRGAAATLVLRAVTDPSEYGIVITDDGGRVTRFLEKPARGQVFSDHANTGIYVVEPSVLDRVPPGQPFDFSKDLFPELLRVGEPVFGYVTDGYWSDIGTPEQYRQAHLDVLDGRVCLPEGALGRGRWEAPGVWVGEGARVAPGARLKPPCHVGPGCDIESGAEVGPYVSMGEGCWVARGATVRHSVLWNACRIGPRAEVRGAILADGVSVGQDARVYEGAVLGRGVRVGQGAVLAPGVRLWPEKVIDAHRYVSRPVVWAGTVSRAAVGPGGVFGAAGLELTPEMAAGVAGAFAGSLAAGSPVAVAHSGSPAARALAAAAAAGAASAGGRVLWMGTAAVGELRTACRQAAPEGTPAGAVYVQVDPETGTGRLRLWGNDAGEIAADRARSLDGAFRRDEWRRVGADGFGAIEPAEELKKGAREAYLTALAERARRVRLRLEGVPASREGRAACRIGVLGEDGVLAGPGLLVRALRACGFDVVCRPEASPDSSQTLRRDGAGGRGARALLWLRVDAAGERLAAWEADGRPVPEAALQILGVLAQEPGEPVWLPADASEEAERLARESGRPVAWSPTPSPPQDGVWLGCAAAAAASALGSLHALLDGRPVPARLEATFPVPWEHVGQVMRRLARQAGALAGPPLDGLKVRHGRGWVLVRPDPDRPLVRLQVEAATVADARDLLERYAAYVRAANPSAAATFLQEGSRPAPGEMAWHEGI